jgi:hypothetical protein
MVYQVAYLVAGLPLQAYTPGARLCLVGADHKGGGVRTFGSNIRAIQRTAVLEWVVTAANPNVVAIEFQPYKVPFEP